MQQINTNNTSIIHVNSLLWLFFGRRKSPSPTLHDEITNHARIIFCWPPISVTKVVPQFRTTLSLVSGVPNMRFSWFFLGPKKPRDFRSRGFSTPQLREALGCDVFDLQMHLKLECIGKRSETYVPIYICLVLFGWYIKYTYSLYIHVWLIYFYIGSIGRLYIYLHGMVELFGEEN